MMDKRKKKLIEPRLQLKFSLAFLSTALVLVLVQAIVVQFALQRVAARMPHDSELLQAAVPDVMMLCFTVALVVLAPLSLGIGVLATFPVLGPLHRFRSFLRQVADGSHPEPCRIRQGDELHDLCALLNEVTAPLRETQHRADSSDSSASDNGALEGNRPGEAA